MKRREYLTSIGKIKSNGKLRHTFATTFLLPTIGYCEKEFNNNLINVYIDEDLDNPTLVLIIDYSDSVEASLNRLRMNPIYIDHVIDDTEIVIKFKIPHVYQEVFKQFLKGKYSEFNNEYKQILTRMYGIGVDPNGKLVTVQDIIKPREYKRKQIAEELNVDISILPKEVFDPPNLEYEIYIPLNKLTNQLTEQLNYE